MAQAIEARFERYCDVMTEALRHADRRAPAQWYLKGLMLPGGRKSVEPMAARVQPHNVRSAHQSMHHLVADSDWSDEGLLGAVAGQVLPVLLKKDDAPRMWIIDDTGSPKTGRHSVGVARQYCGQLGKTENCQVAVSLSLATEAGSLPLTWRLYLPKQWAEDRERRGEAKIPAEIDFATKGAIARSQIEAALNRGVPRGVLLADAAYGDETAFRERLTELELIYAVGVRPGTALWWGQHQPAPPPPQGRGRSRKRLVRDETHQPISVSDLAKALPPRSYRTVTWREGVAGKLSSRFARVRIRSAHRDRPREEEWLLIEWPHGEAEPTRYWFSTLPAEITFKGLVATVKARWIIERDYLELKQELGLNHYEGRSWRGFHHHASLCIAAYGFLMIERLKHPGKKNSAQFKEPSLPKGFIPRGRPTHAASHPLVDRHAAPPPGARHRSRATPVPLLRQPSPEREAELITQCN